MTVLEAAKEIIMNYPRIDEFTNNIHYDFSDNTEGETGLFVTGDSKIQEDVLGGQVRQMDIIMYSTCQASCDYDRLSNSTFLDELAFYLENVEENQYEITKGDGHKLYHGHIKNMNCANAMLVTYLNDEVTGPVRYQLQIIIQYTLDS